MPFSRKDKPAAIPDGETIESLLGERNPLSKKTRRIKPLDQLSEDERRRTNLVRQGIRCTSIQGDPFGVLASWADNLSHGEDERMVS
jgi:hypothetical protein